MIIVLQLSLLLADQISFNEAKALGHKEVWDASLVKYWEKLRPLYLVDLLLQRKNVQLEMLVD